MSAPRAFAQDVRDAIATIPHDPDCPRSSGVGGCGCTRDARVAQQVAAALREAIKPKHYRGSLDPTAVEDFLAVFQAGARGEP